MTKEEKVGRTSFEVPFHDVDAMRIVWHGNFLKYFEIARTDLFRLVSLDVPDLVKRGVYFVVTESRCRHTRSLQYGDRVEVEARFVPNQRLPTVVYRVWNATRREVAARGRTVLAPIDPTTYEMIELPADLDEAMHA